MISCGTAGLDGGAVQPVNGANLTVCLSLEFAQPPERALDGPRQPARGTFQGFGHGRSLVSDRRRRPALDSGLHHAADVVGAALRAVFVAQMNLDPRDLSAEPPESLRNKAFHVRGKSLVALDVAIGIRVHQHGSTVPARKERGKREAD
jgi:hypothetical protein